MTEKICAKNLVYKMDCSVEEKWKIVCQCLETCQGTFIFPRGGLQRVAKKCKRHVNTVYSIFKDSYSYQSKRDDFDISLASEKPGKCGRPRKNGEELVHLMLEFIEKERGDITYRELLLCLQSERSRN